MAFAALTVDLTAKIAQFEESMNRATKSVDGLNKRSGALAAGFKAAFSVVAIGGLVAIAKSGIDAADALGKLSARTGVAVKDLAALQLSADSADTSLEDVGKAMLRLKVSIGDAATGNKALGESLARLGITAKDPKEQLYQLADAVKAGGGSALVASDLNKVLGKSYANLLPLLQQGGDALRDAAKASESFAEAMAKLSPNAEKFNDQLDELKQNAAGAAASILADLVPALNTVLENFKQAQLLGGQGFGFFDLLGLGVNPTQDPAAQLKKVQNELRIAEKQMLLMSGFDPFGEKAALEEKIKQYKTLRGFLIGQVVDKSQKPFDTPATKLLKESRLQAGNLSTTKTGGKITDPLASLLAGTDIGKLAEFDKKVALLNARFDGGRKSTELYTQAMTILVNNTFADNFKKAADEAEFLRLVEEDGIRTTQEWRQNLIDLGNVDMVRLTGLLENTDFSRLIKDQEDMILLAKAFSEGIKDADGNLRKLSEAEYLDAVTNRLNLMGEAAKETKSIAEELGLTFASAFEEAVTGGKKFSDVLKGLAQDIAKILIRRNVTEPIEKLVSGFDFGNLFKGLFSANGNAFAGGRVQAFASGGILGASGGLLTSPTLFPMSGGFGVGGEAGTEAVMPLKRGRDGKLGVAGGGQSVVNVNVYGVTDARSFNESAGQITASMSRALIRGKRFT